MIFIERSLFYCNGYVRESRIGEEKRGDLKSTTHLAERLTASVFVTVRITAVLSIGRLYYMKNKQTANETFVLFSRQVFFCSLSCLSIFFPLLQPINFTQLNTTLRTSRPCLEKSVFFPPIGL